MRMERLPFFKKEKQGKISAIETSGIIGKQKQSLSKTDIFALGLIHNKVVEHHFPNLELQSLFFTYSSKLWLLI